MLLFLLTMILMISMMIMFLKHPMSMGLFLLIQTILIALISGTLTYNYWFSYLLFLIMVGGMLVLFIYMTSIASNEKFLFSMKMTIFLMIMMLLMILVFINTDYFFNTMNTINTSIHFMNMNNSFNLSLTKFLNYPSYMILVMMIIYLFITLIAVVKITDINYGPLRQKI
uniref:NADH-ubiquinone oxidoreductase chain 6 n=1 Tax=Agyrtodes labralis TaxID=701472 RepID=A0A0S2MPT8_9COLE|nr:NADH deshydrogenase subunit 6 [Agyrtodes labralis]